MQPNHLFTNRSLQFWGYVRIISEKVGYSKRGQNSVLKIKKADALKKLEELNVTITNEMLEDVIAYINYRADLLNNDVQYYLMDVEEATILFKKLYKMYIDNKFTCKISKNKQTGEKQVKSNFTGMINILTEDFLRNYAKSNDLIYGQDIGFNDDPQALAYIVDANSEIQGAFSRRYDGAFPSMVNPRAIWEIKEYYFTTTFGSRVADGVYETQLDGHEINQSSHLLKDGIKHIFFVDSHYTWWVKGKSYLCRIIDLLHMGLVDEVIFGKEVFKRWPEVLTDIVRGS